MSIATANRELADQSVGMAQIALVTRSGIARSVLGSCIGLVLHHSARKVSVFAHIVLPQGEGRHGPPGKFADTVLPHMLELLAREHARRPGVVAKMAGGASMFGGAGPIQIGKANVDAVDALLEMFKIPVVGRHIGGSKGRRVLFDGGTGVMQIEVAGENDVTL